VGWSCKNIISEFPIAILITAVLLVGLWVANIVYDHGVPHYISRKIGHGAGGVAFLIAFNLSSAAWPIILTVCFSILLIVARLIKPSTFRGVGGTGRSESSKAEIWFALAPLLVFAIAWLWLNLPSVAVTSLLFMAWGDGITGLVRSQVYHKPVKGLWGSLAMLCACLIISWIFIHPFWIGISASIVAVAVEWAAGDCGVIKWADDNWAIPLVTMAIILGLMASIGEL
jgi:phytol kinase